MDPSPSPILALLAEATPDAQWLMRLIGTILDSSTPNATLLDLVSALKQDESLRQQSADAVESVLAGRGGRRLFETVGLSKHPGLASEVIGRVADRILPAAPREEDAADLVEAVLDSEQRIERLLGLDPDLIEQLLAAWGEPLDVLRPAALESLRRVGIRIAAMGLAEDLGAHHSFAELAALAAAADGHASLESLHDCIESCRRALRLVPEQQGVSVDRVYRMEVVEKGLDRLGKLARLFSGKSFRAGIDLAVAVGRDNLRERGIGQLLQRNTQLLARRISEHTGETGEHYITRSRSDWLEMLARAAGGGVLTAGTTLAKFGCAALGLALLPEAFLAALNYAGSFVLMQFLGLTLATKQPSMTAAALVRALRKDEGQGDLDGIVETTVRITRSQVAAAAGNIFAVIPAALAADIAWRMWKGGPVLGDSTAEAVLASLDPLSTGTIPFAVLTGFLLWSSSILAGAAHNWAVVRQLPEGIAASPRVRKWLGVRGAGWLGRGVGSGMAGIAGNVSLGVLLAVTPMIGKIIGFPLDVRHVTLSTGSLSLALSSLGWAGLWSMGFVSAVAGILVIALLNFGVSFALALGVATRAQGLSGTDKRRLLRAIWSRLRAAPRDFFIPRRDTREPPTQLSPTATE